MFDEEGPKSSDILYEWLLIPVRDEVVFLNREREKLDLMGF